MLLQSRCVTLGKRIAARRNALGWSQNELARRAEVNHPTLFKIEADQRLNPSISVVVRIARALGTTAEALFGIEREETQFFVEANKATMIVEVRPLGRKLGEAARARAQSFVTGALERAGARVREATRLAAEDAEGSRSPGGGRSFGNGRPRVGRGDAGGSTPARRARGLASHARRTRSKARIAIIKGSDQSSVSNMRAA